MNLDVYNTHMELYPYKKDDYPVIEDMYTADDKFTGKPKPCGYVIEDNKLFLPRGTHIAKIENICHVKANYINESDPYEPMEKHHSSLYDLRDEIQEESVKFLKEDKHQLGLNLSTGRGKAQPISTKIPTPDGYKLMGNIKVGDEVFGSDGTRTTVIGVYPQGVKEIYQITFSDGRKAKCCKEHLWEVYIEGTYLPIVISTEEIIKLYKKKRCLIPALTYPVIYYKRPVSSLSTKAIDEKYFIYNTRIYNEIEIRQDLLEYIVKKEGYNLYRDKRITIESKNKEFIIQLRQLLLGLAYTVIEYNYKSITFDTLDKQKYLQIISIRKLKKKEECQCIKVSRADGLYLTEDFIVTHNTFCVAYTSTDLNMKTIVITPNEGIKQQWIETYHKMLTYNSKSLMNIAGSSIIESLVLDLVEPADVYFVNHATLRNYIVENSGYALHKFFKKIKVGIKVYDESHLEFANILLIDFFSNTEKTWYLTATFDRSDKSESVCFKRAFNSVTTYGEIQSLETMIKHVIYHIVNINSHITPKMRATLMNSYQGFNANLYGKYAFIDDQNQTAYNAIKIILKKIENIEGKILIFVPLISVVDDITAKLKKDCPNKSVAAYHSKISKDEKESAVKKDIIVSTIKSCGTGKDIKGLRAVICCEPFASKVIAKQVLGRLRPYAEGKDTYYFDVVDICIPAENYWFRARQKGIIPLVKDTIYLNIDK